MLRSDPEKGRQLKLNTVFGVAHTEGSFYTTPVTATWSVQ